MLVLAIDTAAETCAAAVWDAEESEERGRAVRPMRTGHAEHLMDVIGAALGEAGSAYSDLSRIGVSIGPGSFTGIRVGVAAARGLALALKIPAVGVATLEALAAEAREGLGARPALAVLEGGEGGLLQAAAYDPEGIALYPAAVTDRETALALAQKLSPVLLAGSGAPALAAALPGGIFTLGPTGRTADIAVFARLAAGRESLAPPKPLYLRAPDAKPQAGALVARRSG